MDEKFSHLRGKKILFLGAEPLMIQVVEVAKDMGLFTIATDYNPVSLSPAKLEADEYWDVSWNDFDRLEKRCREQHVEGIFAAFSEGRVAAARVLSDRLGLPFYAGTEQLEITRDKNKFKVACREYGVPTVEEYELRVDLSREQVDALRYPVVIKPADSVGSRGISVVYSDEELPAAVEKALSFSASKAIVAEQYMDCLEMNISYTIQNGKVSLSCISEAIPGYQNYGQVKLTDGWLFPSRYLQKYIDSIDGNVRSMIHGIGIQNGFIFLMGFCDGEGFRIFEAGYRIGGGTTFNFTDYNTGINSLKMMLACSITGEMQGWDVEKYDNPFFKHPCCNLVIMAKPGKIGHIGDMDKIRKMPGVLSVGQYYQTGQEVPNSGALSQTFARVNIVADSPAELADRIQEVYQLTDLRDIGGEDMILSRMDRDLVVHYWEGI